MPALIDKTVVITGAANGLGKALALEFYERGYSLALIDIDLSGLHALQDQLVGKNKLSIHQADISNEADVEHAINFMLLQHNKINLLINNAAISSGLPFEQMPASEFRQIIDVNFSGTVDCCRRFLPYLKKQKGSRICNVISSLAVVGLPGKAAYASSKAAVNIFSKSLRAELAASTVGVSIALTPALKTNIAQEGSHISHEKKQAEHKFLQQHGMHPGKAAKIIADGIEAGRDMIAVGFRMRMLAAFENILTNTVLRQVRKQGHFYP